jgi:hypothetical protein
MWSHQPERIILGDAGRLADGGFTAQEISAMKLISTLRYGSTTGMAPGTGNYGGDLRLFFTTLNPADSNPVPGTPPLVQWRGHGAQDTYKMPNGDAITLNLNVVTSVPNELYIFGSIAVSGIQFQTPLGNGAAFAPGQPAVTILSGRFHNQVAGKDLDVGFEMAVPWDGIMADCHGQWWAIWR